MNESLSQSVAKRCATHASEKLSSTSWSGCWHFLAEAFKEIAALLNEPRRNTIQSPFHPKLPNQMSFLAPHLIVDEQTLRERHPHRTKKPIHKLHYQ